MMVSGELHIDVVCARAQHPGHLEVLVAAFEAGNLGGRAKLFGLLDARGLRIPPTVFLRLPPIVVGGVSRDDGSDVLLRLLVESAIQALETKCEGKVGDTSNPLALALRGNGHESGHWFPARLSIGAGVIAGTLEERRAKVVEEIVHSICSSISTEQSTTAHRGDSSPFDIFIQPMSPAMTTEGEVSGTVWTRSPYTGKRQSTGYVRVRTRAESPSYLSFTEWAAQECEKAAELTSWLDCIRGASRDALCISFGVARGALYLLDLCVADLTASARLRAALEGVEGDPLAGEENLLLLNPEDLHMRGQLQERERHRLSAITSMESTGTSVASGRVVLSSATLKQVADEGRPVILVRESLTPSDVTLFERTVGVVTRIGGPASHLVVMARGRGIAVLPGVQALEIDAGSRTMRIGARTIQEGEWVTIDESTGTLYYGKFDSDVEAPRWKSEILKLISATGPARVFVNADTGADAHRGFRLGAVGVGLCRSENHLLASDALNALRRWLIEHVEPHSRPLPTEVLEALRRGLEALLLAADGRRVHYRLFDAHLEDLLPLPGTEEAQKLARELCLPSDELDDKLHDLRETGGVHGWRGCRWGIRTGFYRQQLRLVAEAARAIVRGGLRVQMAVIVPMVSALTELLTVRQYFREDVDKPGAARGGATTSELLFGCMVETPRACAIIDDIARSADVLCFGTNDLTEATWALSREAGGQVLAHWLARGIVDSNPFAVLDQVGVGSLITSAIVKAKLARPEVNVLACGEQASDPKSAAWLAEIGVDWVSCRAEAVPSVALAIAQSEIARRSVTSGSSWRIRSSGMADAARRVYERIQYARACGSGELAQRLALEWAALIGARLSIPEASNWKFFKRDVIQCWFGRRECRRFPSGWHTEEVLQSAVQYRSYGHTVRYSLFPNTIACHAVSRALSNSEPVEVWRREIESLDHEVPVELFPQQPLSQVCFRAVFWGSQMDIEAGLGQAMYLFEEERCQHPVLRAVVECGGKWRLMGGADSVVDRRIEDGLRQLLDRYGTWLYLRLWDMSLVLGCGWLGIEGYYDPERGGEPFVCDADLPQDLAFVGVD